MTKCIKATFGAITQPHISKILSKTNTRVLELFMFYETRPKHIKVLSCVIYTIISNYVHIDYLGSERK